MTENYNGPSALLLDDYLPLPEQVVHMERLRPGVIHAKTAGALRSEFIELRAPVRFYVAKLFDDFGAEVGQISTGAGAPMAELLSDLCHALADGTARLLPVPPAQGTADLPPFACPVTSPRAEPRAVVLCGNAPFLRRLSQAVAQEMLALEPCLPSVRGADDPF